MITMTPMRALCLLMAACILPGSANAANSGGDQQGPIMNGPGLANLPPRCGATRDRLSQTT